MKKLMIFMLAAASLAAVSCATQEKHETKVIAHRGFWNTEGSAKNSISSLNNAIGLGCFGTELDVWVTSDGIPVVFHDAHTATGIELQSATYGELIAGAEKLANGEDIPTLKKYLETWNHDKVKLILEIKTHKDAESDRAATEKILDAVRGFGVKTGEIEYISFSRDICKALIDFKCGSPVSYLSGDLAPAEAKELLGVQGIDYNHNVLKNHPDWINEARALGMITNVWTVNDEADLQHFIDAGVDYITTDRPDVLMKMLAEQKQ